LAAVKEKDGSGLHHLCTKPGEASIARRKHCLKQNADELQSSLPTTKNKEKP
jgi:hypothetical protein